MVGRGILRHISAAAAALLAFGVTYESVPAGFSSDATLVRIEIGEMDFGVFEQIDGLDETALAQSPSDDSSANALRSVRFARDFISEPSLSRWAQGVVNAHAGPQEMHIIYENSEGHEVGRYILNMAHPMSWTVGVASSAEGGFSEQVEFAVQSVSVF